jgi:hypothetical protein
MAEKRIGIPRATRIVARVGEHDATRPVAEVQSSSCRNNDRCALDNDTAAILAEALLSPPPAATAGQRQRTRYVPCQEPAPGLTPGIAALGLRPPLTRPRSVLREVKS